MAGGLSWYGAALAQRTLDSREDNDNDNRYRTPAANLRKYFKVRQAGEEAGGVDTLVNGDLEKLRLPRNAHLLDGRVGAARLQLAPVVDAGGEHEVLGHRMECHGGGRSQAGDDEAELEL